MDVDERQNGSPDLDRLRRRDPGDFTWLVNEHQSLVLMLGQSMGLYGMDLEDAAAEVFDQVYRGLPKFEGRSPLRTWIYRIAFRTFAHFRRRCRQHKTAALPEEIRDPTQMSPAQHAEADELRRRIWAAVAALGDREAAAVELHYRQGCSLEEIAEALDCPTGTVKTLLFRSRERLRQILAKEASP